MLPSSSGAVTTRHIPVEIFCTIIQCAENDLTTLSNLCLTSKTILPEAQRVLYRNIQISNDDSALCLDWAIDATRATRLLETITKHNTTLARLPQRLYHRLVGSDYEFSVFRPYWELMKQGVRLMVNLKSLIVIHANPGLSFFGECAFRLEVFGYGRVCDSSQNHHEAVKLLTSQPGLKSLYIWRFPRRDDDSIPGNPKFPQLRALTGDRRTIEHILPGQSSVTKLTWIPDVDEDVSTPPLSVASELLNIRVFSLGGYFRRLTIRHFIPYLQSLRVLRLCGDRVEAVSIHSIKSFPAVSLRVSLSSSVYPMN